MSNNTITTETTTETITSWLDERRVDYRISPEGFIDIASPKLSLCPDDGQAPDNPGWAWYEQDGDWASGGLDSFDELTMLLGLDGRQDDRTTELMDTFARN